MESDTASYSTGGDMGGVGAFAPAPYAPRPSYGPCGRRSGSILQPPELEAFEERVRALEARLAAVEATVARVDDLWTYWRPFLQVLWSWFAKLPDARELQDYRQRRTPQADPWA